MLELEVVDGHWRLHGISVATPPAPPPAAEEAAPKSKGKAPKSER